MPAALAYSLSTVRVFLWQGWCDMETKGVNSRKGKANSQRLAHDCGHKQGDHLGAGTQGRAEWT